MLKIITRFLLNIITGANVATIAIMLLVGFSDRINPAAHPTLGCAGMFFPFFIAANLLFLVLWIVIKWQRAWIPIAGFALAYAPIRTYIPLHFGSEEADEGNVLTVISYNVAGYNHGEGSGAVDSIAAWLDREQPDIVCLQEDMNPRHEPFERLNALFEYNDTVHVNDVDNSYINALGIHSRFPILKSEPIAYDSKSNGSAAFFLLIGGDTVVVINNHLESTHLSPEERQRYKDVLKGEMEADSAREETRLLINKISSQMALRAPQADAVHDYIEAHRHLPIIVCGDFNDTPISYVRRTVAKGLTDCFVEAGCGLGLSYNQKGFFFRIDHMMCSSDYMPTSCRVERKITASDHFPLICRLKKVDKP